MERVLAWVKEHPYAAGAIFIGLLIILLWLVLSGGSKGTAQAPTSNLSADYAAEVQAASQMQTAQIAAQSQGNLAQIQATTQQAQIQGAVDVASLQADVAKQNQQLAAQLGMAQINAQSTAYGQSQQTAQQGNQLSYQLGVAQIAGQEDYASLQAQTQQYVSSLSAQVANNQTAAAQAVQLAADNASITNTQTMAGLYANLNQQNQQTQQIQASLQSQDYQYGMAVQNQQNAYMYNLGAQQIAGANQIATHALDVQNQANWYNYNNNAQLYSSQVQQAQINMNEVLGLQNIASVEQQQVVSNITGLGGATRG